MATEISFSGGLTFRVSDSSGNVKFDINNKQPKIVATLGTTMDVNDMFVRTKAFPIYGIHGVNIVDAYHYGICDNYLMKELYTNVSPDNTYLHFSLYFPSSQQSELRATSGTSQSNLDRINGTNRFIPYDDLDKWIPANSGMPIRMIFNDVAPNISERTWLGCELFTYNYTNNPYYNDPYYINLYQGTSFEFIYSSRYIIYYGLHRAWAGRIGGRETFNNSNVNSGNFSTPYIYSLDTYPSGTGNEVIGNVSEGRQGRGRMKMTHCNFHIQLHVLAK